MAGNNNTSNRIDPTGGVRISTDISVGRQTPKTDFGDLLSSNLQAGAGAVANGAAMMSSMIPGAGIVSAAVSSVGGSSSAPSMASQYAGLTMSASASPMVTTVGTGGGPPTTGGGGPITYSPLGGTTPSYSMNGGLANTGPATLPVTNGAANLGSAAGMQQAMSDMGTEQVAMMQLQIQMQNESEMYQSVSNVLKNRGDTAKNSVSNIR
jgi:hypothetical protein